MRVVVSIYEYLLCAKGSIGRLPPNNDSGSELYKHHHQRMDPPPRTLARGRSNKNNRRRRRLRQRQGHARSLWLQATCLHDMERVEHLYQSVYYDNDNDDNNEDTQTEPDADPTTTTTRSKRPRIDDHDPKDDDNKDDDGNTMDTLEDDDDEKCAAASSCPRRRAGEQLALWYLQSGRVAQADALLSDLDYTCRLSHKVFAPLDSAVLVPVDKSSSSVTTTTTTSSLPPTPPCRIWDEFLTHEEYTILHSIFANPQASYWTDHDYHVEPTPSPYFSYAIPLQPPPTTLQHQQQNDNDKDDNDKDDNDSLPYVVREYGFLGHLIHKVWRHLLDLDLDHDHDSTAGAPSSLLWRPNRHALHQCTHVELWAHNRPAVTGHQLHFDSDQEGQSAVVRHPLVSTVLYLSSESSMSGGGATLVTNQRRVSRHVAQTAWVCPPAPRRCVAFDGRVLHGVVPGTVHDKQQPPQQPSSSSSSPKREPEPPPHDTRNDAVSPDTPTNHDNNHNNNNAPSHSNRVTLMLAFWKGLQVRPATTTSTNNDNNTNNHHKIVPGASRPLPTHTEWAKALRQPYTPSINSKKEPQMTSRLPLVLSPVYECVVPPPPPSQQQPVTTTLSCTATTTTTTTTTRSTGQPWTRAMGMPSYDQVFQGF